MMKIVTIPNKILTSPTVPVLQFDSKLKKLIIEMEETLVACVDPQGVGLAATQVGLNSSIFIMKPTPDDDTQVCINPHILKVEETWPPEPVSKKKVKKSEPLEGCLSVPKIWSPVKRAYKVLLEFQDITGEKQQKWFEGFESIIVQHEVDHLQGVLFTQRALEQNTQLYEEKDGELEKMKTIV